MNVLKSEILPIRCEGIDVQTVLGQFLGRITTMSCTYLSLPLRIGRLKRDDEQILVDKVASRLPRWKGRLLNKAGWLALVNLVLSSLVLVGVLPRCSSPADITRVEIGVEPRPKP
jgi:hypothetical protein